MPRAGAACDGRARLQQPGATAGGRGNGSDERAGRLLLCLRACLCCLVVLFGAVAVLSSVLCLQRPSTALQIARSRGASTTILAAREPLARSSQPSPVRVTYPGSPTFVSRIWMRDQPVQESHSFKRGHFPHSRAGVDAAGSRVTIWQSVILSLSPELSGEGAETAKQRV